MFWPTGVAWAVGVFATISLGRVKLFVASFLLGDFLFLKNCTFPGFSKQGWTSKKGINRVMKRPHHSPTETEKKKKQEETKRNWHKCLFLHFLHPKKERILQPLNSRTFNVTVTSMAVDRAAPDSRSEKPLPYHPGPCT